MARIEGITIENYRALRKVTFGETFEYQDGSPLPSMMAVIGPNGSGKSTLLDAFGFLKGCLADGVEEACERGMRGGFDRLRTKGAKDAIKLSVRSVTRYGLTQIKPVDHMSRKKDFVNVEQVSPPVHHFHLSTLKRVEAMFTLESLDPKRWAEIKSSSFWRIHANSP